MDLRTTWKTCLAAIPGERIVASDFDLREGAVGAPGRGEVAVRIEALGLNAGLRHRLGTGRSTTLGPAIGIGDVPRSDGVARVVASGDDTLPVGARVVGLLPWQGLAVEPVSGLRRVDEDVPVAELLTIRGHVGATALAALSRVGRLQPDETVWVSAAAGGVGTCAVQLAQRLGAHVIGSAGGPERTDFLARDLRLAHALDRRGDLAAQLDEAAPEGLDLYLDLVGGSHLELAMPRLRDRGRVVLVGRASTAPSSIALDHAEIVRRRLAVLGMSVTDHHDVLAELVDLVSRAQPPLRPVATTWDGPAAIGEAFATLLGGGSLGRTIVAVGEDCPAEQLADGLPAHPPVPRSPAG